MCEAMERGAGLVVRVCGPCMVPTVPAGGMEAARWADEFRPGDVALIHTRGKDVAHRLLGRVTAGPRTWWLHRGDASAESGVASQESLCAVLLRPARRVRRDRRAGLALLALAFGVNLRYAGVPVPAPVRRLWKRLRRGLTG